MLEHLGFTIITASDGVEAVEIFERCKDNIAVVLLDFAMPKMDGAEAFRALRAVRGDVRVLMSSGYSEEEAAERFAGEGLAGFIEKPYVMSALRAKLREVLEG